MTYEAAGAAIKDDGSLPAARVQAEQVPLTEAAAQQEAQVLPEQQGGDDGDKDRIVVPLDGSDDGPAFDTGGVDEVIDLHKPTNTKDGFDPGGVGGDVRGEGVGYQDPGSATGLKDPGGTYDVPEAGPGGDPSRGIPGLPGQDEMEGWADKPDLGGDAEFGGGDARISTDDEGGGFPTDDPVAIRNEVGGTTSGGDTSGTTSGDPFADTSSELGPIPSPFKPSPIGGTDDENKVRLKEQDEDKDDDYSQSSQADDPGSVGGVGQWPSRTPISRSRGCGRGD